MAGMTCQWGDAAKGWALYVGCDLRRWGIDLTVWVPDRRHIDMTIHVGCLWTSLVLHPAIKEEDTTND